MKATSARASGPAPCIEANYEQPVFDYTHSGGRCSITGGYVYKGSQATLPTDTYVYGDYCSGEILTWDGSTQSVLFDTTTNISSFGEDEQGELYVVAHGGAVSKFVSTTPCTYSIASTSQSFGSGGGAGRVAVTAGVGCGWTATSNASWIHVTSGASGTGNGTVGYSVDANTSSSSRTGTIGIQDQIFTVNQSGAATCTFSISPTGATFTSGGGSGTVAVAAGSGCAWTAVSSATWITITGGASGTGAGTVTYTVAPYTGRPESRSGSITIAGLNFTVKQSK